MRSGTIRAPRTYPTMHRSLDLSVPADTTDRLVASLRAIPGLIGLTLHRGASLVPPGDVISIHALNRAADDVLRAAARACGEDGFTVVTAEVASMSDQRRQAEIDADVDEAIWEELETGLRHQARLTTNFLLLMGLGGIIAAAATVAEPAIAIVAYIASAIIAPGFEPVAKLPLGLVLRRWSVVRAGLISMIAGYAVLLAAAAATWLLLSRLGVEPAQFLEGDALKHTLEPTPELLAIVIAGAFAGVVIIASYRRSVIAGALVAMRLIESAAVAGVALALGEVDMALGALQRLGLDVGFVCLAGLLVFGAKQWIIHRRAPLR